MSSVTSSGPRKAAKVLACVNCQQRKKKCDRRSPCSICIKQNITCIPSKPAPPRRRHQPTKELLERMTRCEELLRQCLEQRVFVRGDTRSGEDSVSGSSRGSSDAATKTNDGNRGGS